MTRLRSVRVALVVAVLGYGIGGAGGFGFIQLFSDNSHDRSMEAVVTGFLVAGPATALLCGVGGYLWARSHRARPPAAR